MAIVFVQMEIDAAPDAILGMLTNFDGYPRWNPILRRMTPDREDRIWVTMHPPGLVPLRLTMRKARADCPTRLVLSGYWLHPLLLNVDHQMEIEPGNGRTVLRQTIRFTGWSQKLFPDFMMLPIKAGFQRMNEAIRDALELPSPKAQMRDAGKSVSR